MYLPTESLSHSENNLTKGKAVEKKEPLGTQRLMENIIAQVFKFVEPKKKKGETVGTRGNPPRVSNPNPNHNPNPNPNNNANPKPNHNHNTETNSNPDPNPHSVDCI